MGANFCELCEYNYKSKIAKFVLADNGKCNDNTIKNLSCELIKNAMNNINFTTKSQTNNVTIRYYSLW